MLPGRQMQKTTSFHPLTPCISLPPPSLFLVPQKLLGGYVNFLSPPSLLYITMKRLGKKIWQGLFGQDAEVNKDFFPFPWAYVVNFWCYEINLCVQQKTYWLFPGTYALNTKYQKEAPWKAKEVWCPSWRIRVEFIVFLNYWSKQFTYSESPIC